MHLKSLILVALSAAAVSAQQLDSLGMSVLSVLRTAIPPESITRAFADPAAFSAELASSLSAGKTPPWYQALPSEVKSYLPLLYPATNVASTTASETAVPSVTSILASSDNPLTTAVPVITSFTASIGSSTALAGNSSVVSHVSSPTLGSTGGANSGASSTGVSTGGAPRMTAVIGAGVAGAFGLVGMFL